MSTLAHWLAILVTRCRIAPPARAGTRPLVLAGLLLLLAGAAAIIFATPPPASSAQRAAGVAPPGASHPPASAHTANGAAAPAHAANAPQPPHVRPPLPGGAPFGPGASPQQPGAPTSGHPRTQATGLQRRHSPAPDHPADILYDQYEETGGTATSSQAFEPTWAAWTDQAADDFVVPPGLAWTVDQVEVAGVYLGPGVASSVNVIVYADAGNLPGTPVFTQTNAAYTPGSNPGDFVIPLNPPAALPAGTYWLSVQANENYNPDGQWFWADRAAQSNATAVWQNPGGGFALGCFAWAPRFSCFIWPPPRPDEVFRLRGTSNATPTPTVTGTPPTDSPTPTGITGTATPTRTPAPTLTGILPTPVGTQPAPVSPTATATPIPACGLLWRPGPSPTPGTFGANLYAVAVVAADDIWAVGSADYGYETLVQHWDGAAWSIVPSPSPGFNYNYLYALAVVSDDDIWAVGEFDDQTLVEHWDGAAWTIVPSPNPPGAYYSYLRGVAMVAADDIWAVGYSYGSSGSLTVVEHWDGGAWAIVPSPSPGFNYNDLFAVSAVAADDVWAVGDADDQTLTEHWDGANWSVVPSPNPTAFNNYLLGVAAVADDNVWAVGSGGYGQQTLTEHWDGTTWTIVPSPNPGAYTNYLNGVTAVAAGDVWAVGSDSSDGLTSQTLAEHWDGTTWSVVPSPNIGANYNRFLGVAAVAASDIWAVGAADDQPLTEHYSDPCATPTPTITGTPPTATATRTRGPTRTPTPTPCGGTGNYTYTTTTGTVVPGTNDIGNQCDECSTLISLPFPYQLYNQTFNSARAGANGELAFGIDVPTFSQITCLPNPGATYTIAPLWVDQVTDTSFCSDCGIFTSISGTAPNRVFNIEWRNLYYNQSGAHTLDYEVRLYEGQLRFDLVYGAAHAHPGGTDSPLTVGVQKNPGLYTEVGCDPSGINPPVTSGRVLIFTLPACGTQTPTAGPTRTPTRIPTARPSPTRTRTPVIPTATPCRITFTDVHTTDYFYEPVRYLYCRGVISGYADNTFRPYNNTTRGQMVKIVVLGVGIPIHTPASPTFSDVPTSHPFYQFVETAAYHNIVSGYGDGTFRPQNNVTRGQLSKIDVGAAGWTLLNPARATFSDVPPGSAFYTFVETAVCHGIISGYADGTFHPSADATRGQISKIVYLSVTAGGGSCLAPPAPK